MCTHALPHVRYILTCQESTSFLQNRHAFSASIMFGDKLLTFMVCLLLQDKGRLRLPKLHGKDKPPEGKPDWTRQSSFGLQYI